MYQVDIHLNSNLIEIPAPNSLKCLMWTSPLRTAQVLKYTSRIATSSVKATIPINGWNIVIDSPYDFMSIILLLTF